MTLVQRITHKLKFLLLTRFVFPMRNAWVELTSSNYILLSASVNPNCPNWGDDASAWLVQLINPKAKVIQRKYSWFPNKKENFLCIGSIITWMTNKNSIIWGSGVVYPNQEIKEHPKRVLAVRGPLSRDYLIKHGVDCPEVYGDPALLFPSFYQPHSIKKKYSVGIVPHFRDKNNPVLREIRKKEDILIIDVQNIKPFNKFIDDICSCQVILSSSLHGIIISDAYGIPNLWIEFPGGEKKRFAFEDYFMSVGREIIKPQVFDISSIGILSQNACISEMNIDLSKLLNNCPFNYE